MWNIAIKRIKSIGLCWYNVVLLKWFCVSFIKVSEHRKLLALYMVHWVELRQNVDPQTGGGAKFKLWASDRHHGSSSVVKVVILHSAGGNY